MFKKIVNEFKRNIFFYSFLVWLVIWSSLALLDRYRKPTVDEAATESTKAVLTYLRDKMTTEDKMKMYEDKLNALPEPTPEYFYLDCNLIEFMYSIREFEEYSHEIYLELQANLDRFLKMIWYVKHFPDTHWQYHNLVDLKNECLNIMHSFVYSLPPHPLALDKLNDSVVHLRHILTAHLETVRKLINQKHSQTGQHMENRHIDKQGEPGFLPYMNVHQSGLRSQHHLY